MIDLSNQLAVITGGSRGIGRASAILLACAGADIAIIYEKHRKEAENVMKLIGTVGRKAMVLKAKVQNERECRIAAQKIFKEFNHIDLLVNSAGIWEYGAIGKMTITQWRRNLDVNLTGTFNMCNSVVPYMKRMKYGRIINISSTAGQRGESYHSAYAAAKGGVIAFTKSIATELIQDGIWVNCVAPGWVATEMTRGVLLNPAEKKSIINSIPRKIIPNPDDIAGPILFLSSSLSNNIVGEIINVNGGSVLCG